MSQDITLDNTVEHVKWKSSSNATAQDVTTVKLDGSIIWEKPDLDIELTSLTYNTANGKVTISVDFPVLINSWKYQIDDGALSAAQTVNNVDVTGAVEGVSYSVSVYGYRDGVLKGAEDLGAASSAEQARRVGTINIPNSQPADLSTPIVSLDAYANGRTDPGDFYIKINGDSSPNGVSDSNRGGFCAIHNPGKFTGMSVAQVLALLPATVPYGPGGTMNIGWSGLTLDSEDGIATLSTSLAFGTCGVAEEGDNGQLIRRGFFAVGSDGNVHVLDSGTDQQTRIDHDSSGAVTSDWLNLSTVGGTPASTWRVNGVKYAAIEIHGNGEYNDGDDAHDNFKNCSMATMTPIAVGTMVGVVASIDHQDRNSDEDSECLTKAVFFENFDSLSTGLPGGSKTTGTLPYLTHPTAYWYINPTWPYGNSSIWDGVGFVGDCTGDNNANLEHTATLGDKTYKIRYRQILNASVPSGLSVDSGKLVTSSTSDSFHTFLPATHMQAFAMESGDSRNYNYIEAYIHSVA